MTDIVEVVPRVFRGGYYIPNGKQAKRNKPSTAWNVLRLGWTTGGQGFEVIEMVVNRPSGDTWLRIAGKDQWVAYLYHGQNNDEPLGELEVQYA